MERKFLQGSVITDGSLGERQIRVIASDPTVDRTNDIMVPEGCILANYRKNPIVLADHDPKCPIGTAVAFVQNDRVEALIDFAPKGISVKADEYCGLAKTGVLRTVSVGFDPLEFEPIQGGGYKYNKWELMELSIVAVPANPNAVIIARSASANSPKFQEAKVGASLNLPFNIGDGWNSAAVTERILEKAGFAGDKPDSSWARKGFLVYDSAKPEAKESYKLPFADVIEGRLVATAGGIRAAAALIAQSSLPDDVAEKARAVINHYEGKMKAEKQAAAARQKAAIKANITKGLYEVSELAYLLSRLGSMHDMARWEAEIEGDGSNVPAMLADALKATAEAFLAMTAEETAELLAGRDIEILVEEEFILAAATPLAKLIRVAELKATAKAGRVLSKDNEKTLRDAHGAITEAHEKCMSALADVAKGCGMVKSVFDQTDDSADDPSCDPEDPECDPDNPDDNELAAAATARKAAEERARRQRQIEILQRQAAA